jgi:hypothetical protein
MEYADMSKDLEQMDIVHRQKGEPMRERHDFGSRRNRKPLSPKALARILRQTTVERDAAETYEKLTGEKIPDAERRTDG